MDDIGGLASRVRRLEREARAWRLFAFAALAILTLMAAAPARVADEVRARKFVSVDARGTPRVVLGEVAVWEMNPSDSYNERTSTGLALYDARGRLRTALSLRGSDQGAAQLSLYDEREVRRAHLTVLSSGTPMMALQGESGIDRAWLDVTADRPALVFRDGGGQRVVLGGFVIHYTDSPSEIRGTGSLVLRDPEGRIAAALPPLRGKTPCVPDWRPC